MLHNKKYFEKNLKQKNIQYSMDQDLLSTKTVYKEIKYTVYILHFSKNCVSECFSILPAQNLEYVHMYVEDSNVKDQYVILPILQSSLNKFNGIVKMIYDLILKWFIDTMTLPTFTMLFFVWNHQHKNIFQEAIEIANKHDFKETDENSKWNIYLQKTDTIPKILVLVIPYMIYF